MTDETIDPRAVEAARGVYDDEYEQSTPGAGRWRERTSPPRRDLARGCVSGLAETERLASQITTRSDGIERGIIWAAVVSVALWGIFALIWWLA